MRSLIHEHLVQESSQVTNQPDYLLVLQRARYLDDEDRGLLEAIFAKSISASQAATLGGLPVRPIRYRVRILCRRLLSRAYVNAMRALPHLDENKRELVVRHILRRQPVKQIAGQLGLSVHHVRRHLAMAEGAIAERTALEENASQQERLQASDFRPQESRQGTWGLQPGL